MTEQPDCSEIFSIKGLPKSHSRLDPDNVKNPATSESDMMTRPVNKLQYLLVTRVNFLSQMTIT